MPLQDLQKKASLIRHHVIHMVHKGKSSHVGTALSIVEILTVLYFAILRIDRKNPHDPNRDRFILSKGHGCSAQYAALAEAGFFDIKILETYYQNGGQLPGHATKDCVPGVEASTGSLGHGLGLGVGLAYAAKKDHRNYKTFILLGDGECNEGSVWEAALAAAQWKLDNLIVIIDKNNLQGCGNTADIMNLEPLAEKWRAFGWEVAEVDGHNIEELRKSLKKTPLKKNRPTVIIADTVKGKGVSYMEHKMEWHYHSPNEEQLQTALKEISTRH